MVAAQSPPGGPLAWPGLAGTLQSHPQPPEAGRLLRAKLQLQGSQRHRSAGKAGCLHPGHHTSVAFTARRMGGWVAVKGESRCLSESRLWGEQLPRRADCWLHTQPVRFPQSKCLPLCNAGRWTLGAMVVQNETSLSSSSIPHRIRSREHVTGHRAIQVGMLCERHLVGVAVLFDSGVTQRGEQSVDCPLEDRGGVGWGGGQWEKEMHQQVQTFCTPKRSQLLARFYSTFRSQRSSLQRRGGGGCAKLLLTLAYWCLLFPIRSLLPFKLQHNGTKKTQVYRRRKRIR